MMGSRQDWILELEESPRWALYKLLLTLDDNGLTWVADALGVERETPGFPKKDARGHCTRCCGAHADRKAPKRCGGCPGKQSYMENTGGDYPYEYIVECDLCGGYGEGEDYEMAETRYNDCYTWPEEDMATAREEGGALFEAAVDTCHGDFARSVLRRAKENWCWEDRGPPAAETVLWLAFAEGADSKELELARKVLRVRRPRRRGLYLPTQPWPEELEQSRHPELLTCLGRYAAVLGGPKRLEEREQVQQLLDRLRGAR